MGKKKQQMLKYCCWLCSGNKGVTEQRMTHQSPLFFTSWQNGQENGIFKDLVIRGLVSTTSKPHFLPVTLFCAKKTPLPLFLYWRLKGKHQVLNKPVVPAILNGMIQRPIPVVSDVLFRTKFPQLQEPESSL